MRTESGRTAESTCHRKDPLRRVFTILPEISPGDETDSGDSRLELFRCGEKICGKIVLLKVPYYIDSSVAPWL